MLEIPHLTTDQKQHLLVFSFYLFFNFIFSITVNLSYTLFHLPHPPQ